MGIFRRAEIRVGAVRLEKDIDDLRPTVRGQVDRQALGAESVPDLFHYSTDIRVGSVNLVHDDHAAQALGFGRLHELLRHRFDARHRIDDDRRGFYRRQHRKRPSLEIRIPRGVDEVDVRAVVVEMTEGGAQRVFQFPFARIEVGHGVPCVHGSPVRDPAGRMQQRFVQFGLARASVSDQRDVTDFFRGIRHFKPSL